MSQNVAGYGRHRANGALARQPEVRVEQAVTGIEAAAYRIPTDRPEADGTLSWDSTTVVVVHAKTTTGVVGTGYTYAHHCLVPLITDVLTPTVTGYDVTETAAAWESMRAAIRNLGRPGLVSTAIAAVDLALWDAKARSLGHPLHHLLGGARTSVPIYGSGGFTTYTDRELAEQLGRWVDRGIPRVKMKIGGDWRESVRRAGVARSAVGDDVELYVDANGAHDRTTAEILGRALAEEAGVLWFEEPVTSDDLDGLAWLARRLPLDVAAGEYGYQVEYFDRLAGSVDVVQADITRCAGLTEWLRVGATVAARKKPLSGHCAPAAHLHAATVLPELRHLEYFHDHVRIERMLFDGYPDPVGGSLRPPDTPGTGLTFKESDAARYRVA